MTVNLQSGVECGGIRLDKRQKSRGTHVATNGFGAKVKVLLLEETSDCIEFAETGNVKTATQSFTFSVPRKTAELTRNAMKLVVIGTLASPYAEVQHLRERASMQNPIETHMFRRALSLEVDSIWLVDSLAGTVLAKSDGL